MATTIFILGWSTVMAYVAIGNYLYLGKVLLGLSRHGLDGSMKFLPWQQLRQVDLFLAKSPANGQADLAHVYLAHIRLITVIMLVAELCALLAWLALAF